MRPIKELARRHVFCSPGTPISDTSMEQWAVNGHWQPILKEYFNVFSFMSVFFLGSVQDMQIGICLELVYT